MPATTLSIGKILSSQFKSLLWLSIIITSLMFFLMVAHTIKIDFLSINPHRSQGHAMTLPFIFGPVFLLMVLIVIYMTFSISQMAQAIILHTSIQELWKHEFYIVAATTPLMAILSWYCYDYLTPSDFNFGINDGADWVPYQHGLTIERYLVMFALQSCVTLFSIMCLKFEISGHQLAKKKLLLAAIVFTSIVGVAAGISKTQPNVSTQSLTGR
jgi:hypothetical protein